MEKSKHFINDLNFAFKYVFKISPLYVFLTIFSAIFNSAYNLFNIVIIKAIIDSIQVKEYRLFYFYLILIFGIGIITMLLNNALSNIIIPQILNKIKNETQKHIFSGYIQYNYEYVNNKEFYDKYYYILENSENSFTSTINVLGELITSIITISGVVYIVFYYDYIIMLITFSLAMLSFICSLKAEKKQYLFKEFTTMFRRKIDYVRRIFYMPDYFKDLRVNDTNLFYNILDRSCDNLNGEISNWGRVISILSFGGGICAILLNVSTIFIFGAKVINGTLTLGAFTMLYNGTQRLSASMNQFFLTVQILYKNSLNVNKFRNFFLADKNKEIDKNNNRIGNIKKIKLENVCYGYLNKQVIYNFNIDIKAGQVYFIVGKNGTGKSTLIHLIAGLLKPCQGSINYYDENNHKLNYKFEQHISVAFQDFKVYNFNILQNITMKYKTSEEDEYKVNELLKEVKLDNKIGKLREGIFTELSGEFSKDGTNFSVGELQRLSLARAIFKDRDVIILDEFTSFSDVEIKFQILNYMRELYRKRVLIVVTHDYSLIQKNDKVIYLKDNGEYNIGSANEILL